MRELFQNISGLLLGEHGLRLLQAVFFLAIGIFISRIAARASDHLIRHHSSPQQRILIRRSISYGIVVIFALAAMQTAGFDLSVLLGAAGILTVALGFASQTSVSNVISGLFLLGENAFSIGDAIRIEDLTGEVLSIDLLSVKIRTFDNLFVRMPNETLLKSRIVNLTRFPIRRMDLSIWVDLREDPQKVRAVLLDVASRNPLCLDEPGPKIFHLSFGEAGTNLQFSVWSHRDHYIDIKNSVPGEVQVAFLEAEIEFGAPRRSLQIRSTIQADSPDPLETSG